MNPLIAFRLCHLLIPVVAALPCVEIQVGAKIDSWNLYGILLQVGGDMNARAWLPYLLFAATTLVGTRLGLRPMAAKTVRVVAIVAAITGLLALVDLGGVALVHSEQPGLLFGPGMRLEARFGLYFLLVIQGVSLCLAWCLPLDAKPTASSANIQGS